VLDVSVTEVRLKRSCVVSIVRQLIASRVPQHVRVGFKAQTGVCTATLHHACKSSGREWGSTFRSENEWRFWLLVSLLAAKGA
jgi:hypothetical protein